MPIEPIRVWRIVLRGRLKSVTTINHAWHVFQEVGAPSASPQDILVDFADNWLTVGTTRANWHFDMLWEAATCQEIAPDPTSEIAGTNLNMNGTGGVGGMVVCPCVLAGVATWRTDRAGRRGRGRTYWAGLPFDLGSVVNGAQWDARFMANINALSTSLAEHYQLGANVYALQLGVWSRRTAGTTPPVPLTGIARVVAHTAQAYVCTMGSRRFGHGI